MADQASQAANTRHMSSETVLGAQAFQYSSNLAEAATGSEVLAAGRLAALPSQILVSRAGAAETAGAPPIGSGKPSSVLTEAVSRFQERQKLFCASGDPACPGGLGSRPNGDRMAGAVLAVRTLVVQQDQEMAAWVVANLCGPVATPALNAAQVGDSLGKRAYLARGHLENAINLCRDVTSDIFVTQRAGTVDPTWYNSVAQEGGLPLSKGPVSLEEMRQMRDVSRFTPAYYARLAALGSEALTREAIALKAQLLQQRAEREDLSEKLALVKATALAGARSADIRMLKDDAADG
jgi:hypothetical protein